MDSTFWHRQSADKPLFPDMQWSRPETKMTAGKLLIIGGNAMGFAAPSLAFTEAEKAGVGTAQLLLPDSLRKVLANPLLPGEFAPSTPSGSFAEKALSECLQLGQWADGVLLAGDLGRNSETAILIEKFLEKHDGQVTLTQDAADYVTSAPSLVLDRPDTTLVISFAQLQKLAVSARFPSAFTFDMDFVRLVDNLHSFTQSYHVNIVTKHFDNIFVAGGGQVSSTKVPSDLKVWRVVTAAHTSVWWLQHPSQTFESLTTALIS
jgi:hypothetical protein